MEVSESVAFNAGCDARLAGLPLTANPYHGDKGGGAWSNGWLHVQKRWGEAVTRRTVPPLPPVQEATLTK
jgi:hypothetical protein